MSGNTPFPTNQPRYFLYFCFFVWKFVAKLHQLQETCCSLKSKNHSAARSMPVHFQNNHRNVGKRAWPYPKVSAHDMYHLVLEYRQILHIAVCIQKNYKWINLACLEQQPWHSPATGMSNKFASTSSEFPLSVSVPTSSGTWDGSCLSHLSKECLFQSCACGGDSFYDIL